MARIEPISRTVYRAPTRGRTYLNARSAAQAEASAMLEARYPSERPEYECGTGYCTYPGYHWSENHRLVIVQKRLARLILRALRRATDNKEQ